MKRMSWTVDRVLPYLLLVGGAIGVMLAMALTVEKISLLENPQAILSCDINPIISCGSVINTPQASSLGVPNTLIGIIGFSAVATIGAALLAGARFKRWFWRGLQVGVTFGIIAVTWLQYQSIYVIGALCPFCMAVWTVMIPIFLYTTLYNLQNSMFQIWRVPDRAITWVRRNHLGILIMWYLVIVAAILERFWDYWSTLL